MKWLVYAGVFVAGAAVGAIITREIAISKIEGPVVAAADALLGSGSYASGQVKTAVNAFIRSN